MTYPISQSIIRNEMGNCFGITSIYLWLLPADSSNNFDSEHLAIFSDKVERQLQNPPHFAYSGLTANSRAWENCIDYFIQVYNYAGDIVLC